MSTIVVIFIFYEMFLWGFPSTEANTYQTATKYDQVRIFLYDPGVVFCTGLSMYQCVITMMLMSRIDIILWNLFTRK